MFILQLESLNAPWGNVQGSIREFNGHLLALQSNAQVGSSTQNKAKNVLSDVCKEVARLVEEKAKVAAPGQKLSEASSDSKKDKKRKAEKEDALDKLEKKYQQEAERREREDAEPGIHSGSSKRKAGEDSAADEGDRSKLVAGADRWYTQQSSSTSKASPDVTNEDKQKQKKAKKEKHGGAK
jgi:hypothetical protein